MNFSEQFSALTSSALACKELVSVAIAAAVDSKARDQLIALQSKLEEAQVQNTAVLEALRTLYEENHNLRQQIEKSDSFKAELAFYAINPTPGDAHVLQHREHPNRLACPSCVNKQEIHILQPRFGTKNARYCPGCETCFPTKPDEPIEIEIPVQVHHWG